jgi:ubiquitin-protein ligase
MISHRADPADKQAMIIGPEGTPYENGCFIFDIFLPLDYNFKSPSVKSMTTNGGTYRYNPNLYADGVRQLPPPLPKR